MHYDEDCRTHGQGPRSAESAEVRPNPAHACALHFCRVSDLLAGYRYGERVEMQAKMDAARTECATELLRASVGAWRMLRYPPDDVAERIANDPSGNERKIWNMQVRTEPTEATPALRKLSRHRGMVADRFVPAAVFSTAGGDGADTDDHDGNPADEDRVSGCICNPKIHAALTLIMSKIPAVLPEATHSLTVPPSVATTCTSHGTPDLIRLKTAPSRSS
jgi:hypothetical protein